MLISVSFFVPQWHGSIFALHVVVIVCNFCGLEEQCFKLCLGPSEVLTANVMQDFACGLLSCGKEALTQFWTTTLLITWCQLIVAILSSLGRR